MHPAPQMSSETLAPPVDFFCHSHSVEHAQVWGRFSQNLGIPVGLTLLGKGQRFKAMPVVE